MLDWYWRTEPWPTWPWPIAQWQGACLSLRRPGFKSHSRHKINYSQFQYLTNYNELLVSLLRQETSHGPQKDILGTRRVDLYVDSGSLSAIYGITQNHWGGANRQALPSMNGRTASASVRPEIKQRELVSYTIDHMANNIYMFLFNKTIKQHILTRVGCNKL